MKITFVKVKLLYKYAYFTLQYIHIDIHKVNFRQFECEQRLHVFRAFQFIPHNIWQYTVAYSILIFLPFFTIAIRCLPQQRSLFKPVFIIREPSLNFLCKYIVI